MVKLPLSQKVIAIPTPTDLFKRLNAIGNSLARCTDSLALIGLGSAGIKTEYNMPGANAPYVQVFGFFVFTLVGVSAENKGKPQVDNQTDDGNDQHLGTFDGLRIYKPARSGFGEDFETITPR